MMWFIWMDEEAAGCKDEQVCVCAHRDLVWNVSRGVQGSLGVHGECRSFSHSPRIIHPAHTWQAGSTWLRWGGEPDSMYLNQSHLSCRICGGARAVERSDAGRRGRGDGKGEPRDSWSLAFYFIVCFYFTSCQIYLPAVNFMFCFFTISTVQGDHKPHLRE